MNKIHQTEAKEVEILKYLDRLNDQWIQSDEIANNVLISKTSVQKIIKVIKARITKLDTKKMSIEVSTNKGVKFSRDPSFPLHRIICEIYSKSFTYELINNLFHETIVSLNLFSLEQYFSVASIRRKIVNLNEVLSDEGISIRQNQFLGDEFSIRSFLFKYYWEIFKGIVWPFGQINKGRLLSFLDEFQNVSGIQYSVISKEQVCYFFAISRIRFVKGHVITNDSEMQQFALTNPYFASFRRLIDECFTASKFTEEEYYYYFYILHSLSFDTGKMSSEEIKAVWSNLSISKTVAYDLTTKMLKRFEENLLCKIEISDKVDLLLIHHEAHLLRCSSLLIPHNDDFSDLRGNFSNFYKSIYDQVSKVLSVFSDVQFDKEIILEGYTLFLYDTMDFRNIGKKIKIAILFSKGKLNEKKMAKKLQIRYYDKWIFEFVSYDADHDLLITDTQLCFKSSKKRFYLEESLLTEKDYRFLEKIFENFIDDEMNYSMHLVRQ